MGKNNGWLCVISIIMDKTSYVIHIFIFNLQLTDQNVTHDYLIGYKSNDKLHWNDQIQYIIKQYFKFFFAFYFQYYVWLLSF